MPVNIEIYKDLIENVHNRMSFDNYSKKPLSRYYTFKQCFEHIQNIQNPIVLELGTSRSFVDGKYPVCYNDDIKYWEPENPEKWDFGAGCFTKLCAEHNPHATVYTVDMSAQHIRRSKIMTSNNENINYKISTSEQFLNNFHKKVDLLYLDTGDMWPIEPTAQLHLREAKIIIRRNILKDNGLILIDDVKNATPFKYGETSLLGKAKYSIPYFMNNGYEMVADEYQVILKKIK